MDQVFLIIVHGLWFIVIVMVHDSRFKGLGIRGARARVPPRTPPAAPTAAVSSPASKIVGQYSCGSGIFDHCSRIMVSGLRFRDEGLRFMVEGLQFMVESCRFTFHGLCL